MKLRLNNITSHMLMNDDPNAGGGAIPPADPTPDPAPEPAPAPVADPTPTSMFDNVPEDWRTQMIDAMGIEDADERSKIENMFGRVKDFKTFGKNYVESQKAIRSGQKEDNSLPENPTDEQLAEWRTANGVPVEPSGYELNLSDGLVLGDDDTRIMNHVFEAAHGLNIPTEHISALTNAMLQGRQAEEQAYLQQDGLDRQTAERQLREQWGQDYNTNINAIKGLMQQLPESVRDEFESARLANGMSMFSSPEVANFFADVARTVNPAATVVPPGGNAAQTIDAEIKSLEDKMGTDEWYKDTAAQKRYQDLVDARERMG